MKIMGKKNVIWIVSALLAVILFFLPWKNKRVRDLPDILKDGRLAVLIESGEHGFTRDSVHVHGFQYELIKKFSDSLGLELVVINQGDTKDAFRDLEKGACDVLVSLRPVMIDSLGTVVSLRPILSSRLMLAQQKDSAGRKTIRKQYELDGDTITVLKNSPFNQRLAYLAEELAIDLTLNKVNGESPDRIVGMVNEKQIGYTVCPEYLTGRLKMKYDQVDFTVPLSFKQDLSWVVNRHALKLQSSLNAFLDEFVESPEFIELYNQYFNQAPTDNY